ncbi:MAG: dipeptide ABC transporter ATP-binding protein DppD [Alphaproteobacteria bacterium PA3]|nr:MAG: dipeptide ABC transporter ATP-binding protein DppD [Alphaproteobacteria bacterium PA3]
MSQRPPDSALLEVRNLRTWFDTERGLFKAVDGISFSVGRARSVGLVGESGCGKSVTSLSLKEPMTSLNPVHSIGHQIVEAIRAHGDLSPEAAKARAIEVLELVRIPSAAERFDDFPHQLSGGMRQRVMIAMALACEPALLIADEPTTALDVTIQAQILDLLRDLQQRLGMAILIITHDLGVIAELVDEVVVMYAGKIVESAPVQQLFDDPQHPYTIGLLGSIPRLDVQRERLATIEGSVPSPASQPVGCRFAPRCPFADARCRTDEPPLRELGPGHLAACWRAPVEHCMPALAMEPAR